MRLVANWLQAGCNSVTQFSDRLAVHLYCSTYKKGRKLDEIAKRFDLPRAKVNDILRFLVEAGLCSQNDDYFLITSQGTHLESSSPHLLKHHTNWRLRAVQAAENLSEEELMYTVNVTLSKKDFTAMREEVVGFIKKVLEERVYPSPPEEMACMNIDWFLIRK